MLGEYLSMFAAQLEFYSSSARASRFAGQDNEIAPRHRKSAEPRRATKGKGGLNCELEGTLGRPGRLSVGRLCVF